MSNYRLALAALALGLLRCRIYFAELHELVVILAARLIDESALVADVLRFRTLEVAAVAHLAHEAEPLRATGKAADKRRRAFVLSNLNFNSCACSHNEKTLAH